MGANNIVPFDSRYVPLTQQKFCCVPTCFQMIMLRNNIPLVSAEEIGFHLGLIVHPDFKHLFYNIPTSLNRPPAGYGTRISDPQFSPNTAFKKLNLPLSMTQTLIDQFKSYDEFISYLSNISYDHDILICYDWPTLFDSENKDHWGHVCVLDRVYLDKNEIRFIDPSPTSSKWTTVKIESLYQAMKFHGSSKSGGFWEIYKH